MRQYYFHIGIHKTASTFLQEHFFPTLNEVEFYCTQAKKKQFLKYLLYTDDFEYDSSKSKALLEGEPDDLELPSKLLVSDEQFYGSAWDGCLLRKRTIDRIFQIYPTVKIIMVLRNQEDLLESLYLQYISSGGSAHWSQFLESKTHPLVLSDAYFKYANYIEYIINTYGRHSIKILFYEELKSNTVNFLNTFCEVLGLSKDSWDKKILMQKSNTSISQEFIGIMRFANKFISSIRQPYQLFPRRLHAPYRRFFIHASKKRFFSQKRKIIPQEKLKEFLKNCPESNRKLASIVNRDLSNLGYRLD